LVKVEAFGHSALPLEFYLLSCLMGDKDEEQKTMFADDRIHKPF